MLTGALKALDKKFKVEGLSWKLYIQHIETLKNNFFYKKLINYFLFLLAFLFSYE